jgi:hypothetical protein
MKAPTCIRDLALWGLMALVPASTWAINKCVTDGQTVYQDAACPQTLLTVTDDLSGHTRIAEFHRRLDKMQVRGVGLLQREPPNPRVSPVLGARDSDIATAGVLSGRPSRAQRDAENARMTAETVRHNEQSRQALIELLDAASRSCDGELVQLPVVGMTDEYFRSCTLHARFRGVQQVVALELDGVALRLYVFPPGRAQRVYSVAGKITAVKP